LEIGKTRFHKEKKGIKNVILVGIDIQIQRTAEIDPILKISID